VGCARRACCAANCRLRLRRTSSGGWARVPSPTCLGSARCPTASQPPQENEGSKVTFGSRQSHTQLTLPKRTRSEQVICWSGRRELNPHHQLGRLELYH
jgi:hypothetical protein